MSDQATIDRATEAFYAAKRAARAGRKAFALSPDAGFVRTMQGAIAQYLEARGQGVSRDDAVKGLELELRGCWPKAVSKFLPVCGHCEDTGWMEHTCWDQHRCGREVCAKNAERQHLYVEPCVCANGDRMRKKVHSTEDAMAAAGRTKKRKSGGWRQAGS
jgi:hypothetical protein